MYLKAGYFHASGLLLLLLMANGCDRPHDLTPLECLTYTPLTYVESLNGYNVAIFHEGKEISSKGEPYSELQQELVLEFQKNGGLKYWLKKDYIRPAIDTVTLSSGKTVIHNILPSSRLQLREIYECGRWVADFNDSTIKMDFGKNDLGLISIEGKLKSLGSTGFALQQTFDFDSIINGKSEKYKKYINTYFENY